MSDHHRDSTFGLQCTVAAKVMPEKNIKSDLKKKSLPSKFFLSWCQNTISITVYKIIIRRERFCERGARQSLPMVVVKHSLSHTGKCLESTAQKWDRAQEPDGCCSEIFRWDILSWGSKVPK